MEITHIILPQYESRRLVFYLAMEEYLADNYNGDSFFLWTVKPTVIFGRNQDIEAEVNLPYCHEKKIEYYRRKSGGGCVYSDEGNLMISYISKSNDIHGTFDFFLNQLVDVLKKLGFHAAKSNRNDIIIDGKKVSGNAFFHKKDSGIVHGTMLYNTDFNVLQKAITPSQEKLDTHGIKSVRQRVVNLKQLNKSLEFGELKSSLVKHFCQAEKRLTNAEIRAIEEIEKTYLTHKFIYGK
jgi:lipoic acid synthetase/lipoate-protein ligase A